MSGLDDYGYSDNAVARALTPLSLLYCGLVGARRYAYQHGWRRVVRLPVPVIIVGNITVGGTGKTPLVAWLVQVLREAGYRPGIVSRGYGGQATSWPQWVTPLSDPREVGDEPVLLARRTGCPLAVAPDRVAAAHMVLARGECNVIVADDGLQHYRLGRDVEIAVVDGVRRLGNGRCLPAGPLREPARRLTACDAVVVNGGTPQPGEVAMRLVPGVPINLRDPQRPWSPPTTPLHAVAGIGHPARFFATLRDLGMQVIEHPFPDHAPLRAADLAFGDENIVLMTEKDAVKCQSFAQANYWYLPVTAELPADFSARIVDRIKR